MMATGILLECYLNQTESEKSGATDPVKLKYQTEPEKSANPDPVKPRH